MTLAIFDFFLHVICHFLNIIIIAIIIIIIIIIIIFLLPIYVPLSGKPTEPTIFQHLKAKFDQHSFS